MAATALKTNRRETSREKVNRPIPEHTVQAILKAMETPMRAIDVAAIVHCRVDTVYRVAKAHGLEFLKNKPGVKPGAHERRNRNIQNLRSRGITNREIAKRFGLSESHTSHIVKRLAECQ